jgi:uncharacterized membrane protein
VTADTFDGRLCFRGLGFAYGSFAEGSMLVIHRVFVVPDWFIAALLALLPVLRLLRWSRGLERRGAHRYVRGAVGAAGGPLAP